MNIGLDFDNTIVCYDSAIEILTEKLLRLPISIPRTKVGVRDYLRVQGRENDWTCFQGELYGPGMEYARPFPGAIDTMLSLRELGHKIYIVSHRSMVPYAGPKYDLHYWAKDWIDKNLCPAGLFKHDSDEIAYFLPTKEMKTSKILDLQCNVFVDDLPDILNSSDLGQLKCRILFNQGHGESSKHSNDIETVKSWVEVLSVVQLLQQK